MNAIRPGSARAWLLAIRPRTLPVSLAPVLVGTAVAWASDGLRAGPALAAALGWHDTMRQGYGTAALIQAQRDWFGRHGFARLDMPGRHHGPWWTEDGG